jgi:ATP-binding cassette, subfamily F, member 3
MLTDFDPEMQVLDAVRPTHKEFVEQQRRDLLARFGLTADMVFQRIESLSGGERNRTALARLSASDANVLILDEPTNHLDLWARGALEKALAEFDGSVLFVSHDRYFLNQVATKLLIVEPGRFRVIDGNYDTYLHFVRAGLAQEARAGVANPSAGTKPGPGASRSESVLQKPASDRPKRKFSYRKAHEIEQEIAQREARIQELTKQRCLNCTSIGRNPSPSTADRGAGIPACHTHPKRERGIFSRSPQHVALTGRLPL